MRFVTSAALCAGLAWLIPSAANAQVEGGNVSEQYAHSSISLMGAMGFDTVGAGGGTTVVFSMGQRARIVNNGLTADVGLGLAWENLSVGFGSVSLVSFSPTIAVGYTLAVHELITVGPEIGYTLRFVHESAGSASADLSQHIVALTVPLTVHLSSRAFIESYLDLGVIAGDQLTNAGFYFASGERLGIVF